MTDNETTELSLLYKGPSPTVDIIAVENIAEQYRYCWTYQPKEGEPGEPVLWLSHPNFLPKDLPRCRIFSFGYKFGDESRLSSLTQSLLDCLAKVRTKKRRPIFLLGLGFGAAICIQALLLASGNNPEIYDDIWEAILINFPRVDKKRKDAKKDFRGLAKKLLPDADDDVYDAFADTVTHIKEARDHFADHRAHAEKHLFIIDDSEELDPKSNRLIGEKDTSRIRSWSRPYSLDFAFRRRNDDTYEYLSEELQRQNRQAAGRTQRKNEDEQRQQDYEDLDPPEPLESSENRECMVYKVIHRRTKERVARKKFRVAGLRLDKALEILRLLKSKTHPNIVEHLDFWAGQDYGYIVMELCKGSLADLQKQCHGPMPQRLLYEILIQVTRGIEHLHTNGICHRDLKPDNVLFLEDENGKPCFKIVDFDISCTVTLGVDTTTSPQPRGTRPYVAPEVFVDRKYNEKADIWGLGCLMLYFMVATKKEGKDRVNLLAAWAASSRRAYRDLQEGKGSDTTMTLPDLNVKYNNFRDLLSGSMLQLKADKRMSAKDLRKRYKEDLSCQAFKITLDEYRKMSQNLWNEQKGEGGDTADSKLNDAINFLRYCLEVDFQEKGGSSRVCHRRGLDLLLDTPPIIDINELYKGWSPLGRAAYDGDIEVMEILLDLGAKVDQRDSDNATPLLSAAMNGHPEIVKMLLKRNAKVDLYDNEDNTPLLVAAGKDVDIVELLLEHGAKVSSTNKYGWTALHAAIEESQVEITKILISRKLDTKSEYGRERQTPLHTAASKGSGDIVKLLLETKVDLEAKDRSGNTPLHVAAKSAKLGVVKILMKANATIMTQNLNGEFPFHSACEGGDLEITKLLLAPNPEIMRVKTKDEQTALHIAASNGHVEIVNMLLDMKVDIDAQDANGNTPLHVSAKAGYPDVVKVLMDWNADPTKQNIDGEIPLHLACEGGYVAITNLLLERDPEQAMFKNKLGWTALHIAASNGQEEIVTRLLAVNPSVLLTKDGEGRSALHRAIGAGKHDIARILVSAGSDVNIPTGDLNGCLQLAVIHGHKNVVEFLLNETDTNPNARVGWYGTALQAAARFGDLETVELLLEKDADTNVECGWFGNALCAAANHGHNDVVQLLVEKGMNKMETNDISENQDVKVIDDKYWLPLYLKTSQYGLSVMGKEEETGKDNPKSPPYLPTSLDESTSSSSITLSNNDTDAFISEPGTFSSSVRANHPIPSTCGNYYFEVTVISQAGLNPGIIHANSKGNRNWLR